MVATLDNPQVLIEVLSRLSPENLLRLKPVCKSWYALINDPNFVTKHFLNSLQHKHLFLKHFVTKNSVQKDFVSSILKFPFPLDRSVTVLDVHLQFLEGYRHLEIGGHSHGLVCLTDRTDIFLCNPTTREFCKLPPSILLLPEPPREPDGYHSMTSAIGFGYDAKGRDFKVVRVVEFMEGPGKSYPIRTEIYNLSKDKWREIESPVCGWIGGMDSFELHYEGTYYWWGLKEDENEFIQSFNMSEEVFGEILLPESFDDEWIKYRSLGVLNGSIVLFRYPCKFNEKPFEIWEMDIWEMGKNECGGVWWSKLLAIGPVSGIQIEKPLGFVTSDELLMEVRELGRLILYNVKTLQIKELPIRGDPESFQASFFVESLLSVKGGNEFIRATCMVKRVIQCASSRSAFQVATKSYNAPSGNQVIQCASSRSAFQVATKVCGLKRRNKTKKQLSFSK